MYYVTPDLNPQGDSLARGVMRFADGEPLGERGLFWLAVRLCNTYGEDKITFEEMQTWATDNHNLIVQSATDPFGSGDRLWTHAESELEFWQTCVDWTQATGMDNPAKFVCTLPVHQDGSNNGLQLLSLIGRDVVGAKLTNCSADPERFDIYSATADVVMRLVTDDIQNGVNLEQAHKWVGHINRSVCKRACMTTSYGVTPRGIQDQLIKDGFCDVLDGNKLENAAYMRDKLLIALNQTIVASRPIMDYFQKCATALAEFDKPLRWVTPVGSTIQQSYWNVAKSDVKTVMGSYFMWDENPDGGLNVRKQMLSSSPNIIHSLDAALMQKVVVEMREEHHVHSIAAIHDSFAVLPSHVDTMRDVIRQTAYRMFKGNWIADEFEPYIHEYAPDVDLPDIPPQGSFDVSEVLKAKYFFA
jgi:DNA-directed RNA polymerase